MAEDTNQPPEPVIDKVAPGIVPGATDDFGEASNEHGFKLRLRPESGWFAALTAVDGEVIPGYHEESVKRIGAGKFAGLRTEIQFHIGDYTTSTLTIRLSLRHVNRKYNIATILIPLDGIAAKPTTEIVESDDASTAMGTLLRFCPGKRGELESLKHGRGAVADAWADCFKDDTNHYLKTPVDPNRPATYIQMGAPTVRVLSFDVQVDKLITLHSIEFSQPGRFVPLECKQLREALVQQMNQWSSTVSFQFFFRVESTFDERWETRLSDLPRWSSPYSPFIQKTRDDVNDLAFDNFTYDNAVAPEYPTPAAIAFMSDAHRTVSLLGGIVEEVEMLRKHTDELFEMTLPAVVVANPAAIWTETEMNETIYGIKADGTPQHQFFLVSCKDIARYIPGIGDKCSFYVTSPFQRREPPISTTTDVDALESITNKLLVDITAAYDRAMGDVENPLNEVQVGEAFETFIAAAISPFVQTPLDSIKADNPNSPLPVLRALSCMALAHDLAIVHQVGSDFKGHLLGWAQAYVASQPLTEDDLGEAWSARRVNLPPGTTSNVALFSVWTPTQKDWPAQFQSPPLAPGFKTTPVKGALNTFLRELGRKLANGDPSLSTINVKLWMAYDEVSARTEAAAVTDMNSIARGSVANGLWKWTRNFQTKTPQRTLLQLFPALQESVDDGSFRDEHATILRSLPSTAGSTFVDGGPGSGKSTLCTAICCEIIKKGGRIAWIAPSNALVQDACNRLSKAIPDKTIRRVMPWEAELRALTTLAREISTFDPNPGRANEAEKELIAHINTFNVSQHKMHAASLIPSTLNNLAKALAEGDRETWADYLRGQDELKSAPDEYAANWADNMAAARKLLGTAAKSCDAICATPVAFAQLMNHVDDMDFTLLIVDEAGRFTEAQSFISLTKCPRTPHIFVGDNHQFAPISLMRDDREEHDFFGPQRRMSLFRRVEKSGQMSATLRVNHRAHGHVVDWAANYFYSGEMQIFNEAPSSLTVSMRKWLAAVSGARKPTSAVYVFDVQESTEIVVGTSFANPVNALFGRELVSYMYRESPIRNAVDFATGRKPVRFGSVLVIVGYSAQKHEWEGRLRELSPAEVPLDRVEIRTIDDSASHEADIVICDLTRTDRAGFLNDKERLTVMATRARVAFIVIGTKKCTSSRTHLADCFHHVEQRQAYITIRKNNATTTWHAFCTRCIRHGHEADACRDTPQCTFCASRNAPAEHATRNCPLASEYPFPDVYSDANRPDDGIDRDPMRYSDITTGKRAKFRRSQKKTAPEKPDTADGGFATVLRSMAGTSFEGRASRMLTILGVVSETPDTSQQEDITTSSTQASTTNDIPGASSDNTAVADVKDPATSDDRTATVDSDFWDSGASAATTWPSNGVATSIWGPPAAETSYWDSGNGAASTDTNWQGDGDATVKEEERETDSASMW